MERVEEKLFVAIYVGEKNRWQEKSRTLVGVLVEGEKRMGLVWCTWRTFIMYRCIWSHVREKSEIGSGRGPGARRQATQKIKGQPHKVREYGYPDEQG